MSYDRVTKWGVWQAGRGLEVLHLDKWIMRGDLTGVHFETGTIAQSPFVIVGDVDKDSLSRGYKWQDNSEHPLKDVGPSLYGDIWFAMQETMNFSYSMV